MTTKSCDYEFLLPTEATPPAAPVPPDAEAAALLSAAARAERPRRFAFVQLIEQEGQPRRADVVVHGVQHPDGTVLMWGRGGHPFGWYTSIDSAHTRMPFGSMCLVWLDSPRDADTITAADAERDRARLSSWVVTAPFLAYGASDARLRAIDVLDVISESVPGLQREYSIIADTTSSTALSLFCEQDGCDKPPYHDGPHTTETPTDAGEPVAAETGPSTAEAAQIESEPKPAARKTTKATKPRKKATAATDDGQADA